MRMYSQQRTRLAAFCALAAVLLSFLPAMTVAQLIVDPPITANVNTLTFADVDIRDATTSKWLFTVNIRSGNAPLVLLAVMDMKISAHLANGEVYQNAIELVTSPFKVPRAITNIDLTNKNDVQIATWNFDETAKNRFKDLALATGAMPPGIYHFDILVSASLISSVTQSFDLVLTNPSSIDLIFPAYGDPSVSPLPLFQWRFDGTTSRISIFEKRPQQATLEEAANGVPQLSTVVNSTSFQYPSAGARSLEPGKTYVWYVEGLANVAGGVALPIRSELRSFVVSAQGAESLQSYLDDLERALDAKYKPVFDEIRSEGLLPTGIIRINGSVISVTELLAIIREIRMNPDAIQNVGLEQ